MLAAVYLQPSDMPLLIGAQYAGIAGAEGVDLAAPLAFGDSWQGYPVVGTTADFIAHLSGGPLAGRMFAAHEEAVVGAARAARDRRRGGAQPRRRRRRNSRATTTTTMRRTMCITGSSARMPPTGSPWDRAILVPVEIVWELHGLANGHDAEPRRPDRAALRSRLLPRHAGRAGEAGAAFQAYRLRTQFSRTDMMAFFPGAVLSRLHGLAGDIRAAMSLLTVVSQILVAAAILAGLILITRLFARNLAVLRALGAGPRFVLAVVWSYGATLLASARLTAVRARHRRGGGACRGSSRRRPRCMSAPCPAGPRPSRRRPSCRSR